MTTLHEHGITLADIAEPNVQQVGPVHKLLLMPNLHIPRRPLVSE